MKTFNNTLKRTYSLPWRIKMTTCDTGLASQSTAL